MTEGDLVQVLELVSCPVSAALVVELVDLEDWVVHLGLVEKVAWVVTPEAVELLVEALADLVEALAVVKGVVLMVVLALSFTFDFDSGGFCSLCYFHYGVEQLCWLFAVVFLVKS
ncbi:uncharacterized protein LOC131169757 [Hevea brasiliensis]|uniref:uncharacterized protein LOC131169757 n=1 Tax=Hevea brasiliensis TaxID=3981 RepID=UPI0025FD1D09|nr:uncharacterized protein LOC131169757 [Hevea brasiliensis]